MNFLRRNMFWIYIALLGLSAAGVTIFGVLAKNEYEAKNKKTNSNSNLNPVYHINGDYINGDKQFTEKPKDTSDSNSSHDTKQNGIKSTIANENKSTEKLGDKSKAPTVNNGIINSGVNYGNQTVNNHYNENEPRQLTKQDIEAIENNIPLDSKIIIEFVNSTQECVNYTGQIISVLKKIGYNVNEINANGMLLDGRPSQKGERFYIDKGDSEKTFKIVIKEQK